MTKAEALAAFEAKAKEIGLKHGKEILHDINQELLPLGVDVITASIPGDIDDAAAAIVKPILTKSLDSVIDGL